MLVERKSPHPPRPDPVSCPAFTGKVGETTWDGAPALIVPADLMAQLLSCLNATAERIEIDRVIICHYRRDLNEDWCLGAPSVPPSGTDTKGTTSP